MKIDEIYDIADDIIKDGNTRWYRQRIAGAIADAIIAERKETEQQLRELDIKLQKLENAIDKKIK